MKNVYNLKYAVIKGMKWHNPLSFDSP